MHGPSGSSIEEPLTVLAELQQQGLIKHIGLSNVNAAQVAQAKGLAEIVCVQNNYNVAHREDDGLIDELAARGIAYVPFFPLGGFSPLQSSTLNEVAASLEATPMQVALAWLLQRAPNMLLIPGDFFAGAFAGESGGGGDCFAGGCGDEAGWNCGECLRIEVALGEEPGAEAPLYPRPYSWG